MELMTPQILWKDFDTQASFDESLLRFVSDGDRKIKEFYFSGLRTSDGVIRIFARYLHNGDDLPTLVYFGEEKDNSLFIPEVKLHNFLVVDYTGVKKGKSRGTIYPYSLIDAESDSEAPELSPKESRWYAWASVAMSAVLYAKTCGNGKVGVIGMEEGGSLVWKLSVCVGADVGVTLFSTGYEPNREDIYYRACLDNRSYAPLLRFPVLEIVSSNENDGSLDFMSEIYSAIKRKDSRFCINERSKHSLGEAGKRNVELWIGKYLRGEGEVPEAPTVRPYESGGKLYYEVKYEGIPDKIDFYVSMGNSHGAMRNWSSVKLMRLEESYLASVKPFDVNASISAFVTVKEKGYKISSAVATRIPAKMGIVSEEAKPSRLIYDSDMGIDDWAMEDNVQPQMQDGPYGISGVVAENKLYTFKLADSRFRGPEEGLLQIMFCTKVKQRIKLSVVDANLRAYSLYIDADYRQGWITKSLSKEDFKTDDVDFEGVSLPSWRDAVTFEIAPPNGIVLISSLLWV